MGSATLPAIDQIRYVHAAHQDDLYHSVVPMCIQLTQDNGDVLGEVDDKNGNTGGDNDGAVLGAGDTLAATGVPAIVTSALGVVIGATGIAATKLSKFDN